jgi:peptidyl-dipeptidase Dcp
MRMAKRSSTRVIENLTQQLSGLQRQRAVLARTATSASISANPLLQDWTITEPFGLPPFTRIETSHFKPAFDEAMKLHLVELSSIANNKDEPTFENVIAEFDRCGGELSKVSGVFGNLCGSLNTKPLQEVQTEMAPVLAGHSSKLYTLPGLFERINAVHEARKQLGLSSEQVRLTERIYTDFTRAGAKFDAESKTQYAEITAELASLMTQFQQNVMEDESSFTMVLNESDLSGCPSDLIAAAKQAAVDNEKGEDDYVITLSRSLVEPFITFSDRRDLREKAWRAWTKRGELDPSRNNQEIATQILKLRKRQAGFHGCSNFAEYQVENLVGLSSCHYTSRVSVYFV